MFKGFYRLVHLDLCVFQKRLDDGRRLVMFLQVIYHILTAVREVIRHCFAGILQAPDKTPAAIRQLAVFVKLKAVTFAPEVGVINGHLAFHQILRFFSDSPGHFFSVKLF